MNEVDDIENLDTPIGKEILSCILLKNGYEIAELLENYTLDEFIDERCELYLNTLSSCLTGDGFHKGNISYTGAEEIARAEAFLGL